MHHIFIFTIGPVQSFIAQARKTQDLYAGSQLLSDLIRFAFHEAERNSENFTLIFPYSGATSMPNRFVALLSPREDIKTFGNNLIVSVKDHLLVISKEAMGDSLYEIAEPQISDFLEAYWAAIPYDRPLTNTIYEDGKTYYQRTMGELERVLGGVKNYRSYSQFAEEPGRKCSVNGYYNALFYRKKIKEAEKGISAKETKHLWQHAVEVIDDNRISFSELDSGEGISGVTMLRRCYFKNKSFLSTAGVALLHLIAPLKESDEYKQLPILLGENLAKFNHQFLYPENMASSDYWFEQGKDLIHFTKVNEFYEQFQKLASNYKFLKYYAIIVFDADDMGEHFSNCKNPEEHTELSKALSDYAKWAREYVDDGRGITVYAGGDDYLGMLNLTTLFETVETLRREFGERFKEQSMAFSAGIAIAHYKTPLGEVMNYARNMEKKAKERDGKNAFGIVVMKHSGEILETVLPWVNPNLKEEDSNYWNINCLKTIHKSLESGVSAAFIKNLHEELPVWENKPSEFREVSNYEISRYIKRACGGNEVKDTIESVQGLYALVDQEESNHNFLNTLNIVDFLNRKV